MKGGCPFRLDSLKDVSWPAILCTVINIFLDCRRLSKNSHYVLVKCRKFHTKTVSWFMLGLFRLGVFSYFSSQKNICILLMKHIIFMLKLLTTLHTYKMRIRIIECNVNGRNKSNWIRILFKKKTQINHCSNANKI